MSVTPLGVFGGWLSAAPAAGVVLPSSRSAIQLAYDISQNEFQGKYQAEVLLTTTARPVAKVRTLAPLLPSTPFYSSQISLCVYVHCDRHVTGPSRRQCAVFEITDEAEPGEADHRLPSLMIT